MPETIQPPTKESLYVSILEELTASMGIEELPSYLQPDSNNPDKLHELIKQTITLNSLRPKTIESLRHLESLAANVAQYCLLIGPEHEERENWGHAAGLLAALRIGISSGIDIAQNTSLRLSKLF